MNRGDVYSSGNLLPDPERIAQLLAAPRTSCVPVVTVRRWNAQKQRHDVLHRGAWMREKVFALGEQPQMPDGRGT